MKTIQVALEARSYSIIVRNGVIGEDRLAPEENSSSSKYDRHLKQVDPFSAWRRDSSVLCAAQVSRSKQSPFPKEKVIKRS